MDTKSSARATNLQCSECGFEFYSAARETYVGEQCPVRNCSGILRVPGLRTGRPIRPMGSHVVLAGHGSRAEEANDSLALLAQGLAAELELPVHTGYLEMAEPTIPQALRAAAAGGARRIVLVPYFLSPGMHVRRDLVAIVDEARRELGVPIVLSDFLGAHEAVPRLLASLARAGLSGTAAPLPEQQQPVGDGE